MKIIDRKIVVVNQAVNYLTIGICNELAKEFDEVSLITGSIHEQGEKLNSKTHVSWITKWKEEHGFKKAFIYGKALLEIYFLLLTKYRKQEVFFISAPPMGYLLNIVLPHKFSMLVWDVFPDTFKITGMQENHFIYKSWAKLNHISFKKAYKIFSIGNLMADLLSQYVSRDKIIIQPIWSIFQEKSTIAKNENVFIKEQNLENKFVVQYSGNIGLTHKVETMVVLAEKMQNYENIIFQIIGRGPRKKVLENLVQEKKLRNCQFLPFQSDDNFPYSLAAADLGVVILDEVISKGSVPSKAYNLMNYGIPSLYFSAPDSELQHYTKIYKHAECFTEKELDKAEKFILKLIQDTAYYAELSANSIKAAENFKRKNAMKFVEKYINELVI